MNINKLTVTTIFALAIALPTGQVLSQEKESTVYLKPEPNRTKS